MTKFKSLYLFFSFSWLFIHAAYAEGEIELQFVSFPKSPDAKPVELFIGEGKTILVELPTNSISPVYKVKQLSKWMLGKTVTDDEGKPSFDVYGQAPAISSTKQLILVIRKGKDGAGGLTLIPMDYNQAGFGGGKYLLINATKIDIGGAIGTDKFSLKPGKYTLLAPKPTKVKGDRKYCFAIFFYRKEKNIQPFFSSTWRFNTAARSVVFFYNDPSTRKLKLHTIRSYVK